MLSSLNLTVRWGEQVALRQVDVALAAGRWTAIVGPNGAGKSTLLRALAGLQRFEGEVRWNGRPLPEWSARERARFVAWLGQGENGGDDLQAHDVVALGRLPHQAWLAGPSAADEAVIERVMRQTQCWAWRTRPLSQLSGGERQRVLLARALAVEAAVLLMDEPLSHLDPPHQADWLHTVQGLRDAGTTVVSVLHELNMALMADALLIVADGQVRHHGAPQDSATRTALAAVFDDRIALHHVAGQWVALPRLTGAALPPSSLP